MKILVVGASGKTGQKVLEHLAKIEHAVTGMIRDSEQTNVVKRFGAEILLGDLEADVNGLVKNFDAIIFVAGSRGKNVQGVDYQGLAKMVDAAVAEKIKRFLYIGSINTGKEPAQFIQQLKDFYRNNNETVPEGLLKATESVSYHNYVEKKALAEKYLVDSGLDYTILRAGLLTMDPGSDKVNVTSGTLNAFGKISRENVANCFIEALENEKTYRKIYTILDGDVKIHQAFK